MIMMMTRPKPELEMSAWRIQTSKSKVLVRRYGMLEAFVGLLLTESVCLSWIVVAGFFSNK